MHTIRLHLSQLFGLSLLLLVFACNREPANDTDSRAQVDSLKQLTSKLYTLHIDDIRLNVEIAQDPESLEKGLMFRRKLPEDQGMLFVFPYEHVLSFWMRNTYIPLDIAFIDASGKVIDIQYMEPIDESKHYVSSGPALYALEVNGGWFARHQLGVGAMVVF